jgi:hypothetical protein
LVTSGNQLATKGHKTVIISIRDDDHCSTPTCLVALMSLSARSSFLLVMAHLGSAAAPQGDVMSGSRSVLLLLQTIDMSYQSGLHDGGDLVSGILCSKGKPSTG